MTSAQCRIPNAIQKKDGRQKVVPLHQIDDLPEVQGRGIYQPTRLSGHDVFRDFAVQLSVFHERQNPT
jgi:hypothetical protein